MKKVMCFFIMLASLANNSKSVNVSTNYYARSYIVMDFNSKEVLEGKDIELVRSVASISKIMTAIIAIENSNLEDYVEVNEDILKAYGSSIYLKIGEVIKMKDLIYGLMLRSGNDAAVTIAKGVSGSIPSFVELMNDKAKKIGMKNSTFNNPSGLDVDDDGNLSTSYDMALLMQYAMQNEIFRQITSTKEYKSNNHGTWLNKNRLLREYENTSGGKTGFTTKARRTLVTSAKKGDTELIIVTLDCGGDFSMHKQIYEKYFNNYKTYKLLNKGINNIEEYELDCSQNINVLLEKNLIKDSEIIYEIREKETEVYLINGNEKKSLGVCKSVKTHTNKKKRNWLKRIFNIDN